MRVGERWLREWVDSPLSMPELAEQLTMTGLETESAGVASAPFSGVVVSEIVAVKPHPGADRLSLCEVSVGGGETFSVVCGAPNVAVGMRAPLARVGAVLPDGAKIRRAQLRGERSEGMLCAASELGLGESRTGLLALPADAVLGQDLRESLALDEPALTLDVPPNRGDCLSVLGVAREVAALNRTGMAWPAGLASEPSGRSTSAAGTVPVRVQAPADCPRYLGCVVRGLDTAAETPLWMRERLRHAGLRAIHPVVDVTNYVMLACGQPMHAFDLSRLRGGIVVRCAAPGESLTLLNGQQIACQPDDLLIADAHRGLALAGIMGTADSVVDADSAEVFLEAAHFAPQRLAGRARRYGLQTEASHRFERGVDSVLPHRALRYALHLLESIAGGEAEAVVEGVSPRHLPAPARVRLEAGAVRRTLGFALPVSEMASSLSALGFDVEESGRESWSVTAPSWRFDIAAREDLIEEMLRMHGYGQLPESVEEPAPVAAATQRAPEARMRAALAAQGYNEVINYSFADPSRQRKVYDVPVVAVSNPLSADAGAMRVGLWCGLLDSARSNQSRQRHRLRLFECGRCFRPRDSGEGTDGAVAESTMLAALAIGARHPESWAHDEQALDFFDIKADLVALPGMADCHFESAEHPALRPGRSARVLRGARHVGDVGELHPALLDHWELKGPAFLFEVDLADWPVAPLRAATPPSRFPSVRRDIALVAPDAVSVTELTRATRESAGPALNELIVMDVYRASGDLGGQQRRSIALGLVFQRADRTMKNDEITCIIENIINVLYDKYEIVLRS